MNIDLDLVVKVATFVLALGSVVFTFFATRREDVDIQFETGSKRMENYEARLVALEVVVNNMPGKDEMHQLQLMMTEMAGDMKAVREGMRGLRDGQLRQESILGRHEDHLRENS